MIRNHKDTRADSRSLRGDNRSFCSLLLTEVAFYTLKDGLHTVLHVRLPSPSSTTPSRRTMTASRFCLFSPVQRIRFVVVKRFSWECFAPRFADGRLGFPDSVLRDSDFRNFFKVPVPIVVRPIYRPWRFRLVYGLEVSRGFAVGFIGGFTKFLRWFSRLLSEETLLALLSFPLTSYFLLLDPFFLELCSWEEEKKDNLI